MKDVLGAPARRTRVPAAKPALALTAIAGVATTTLLAVAPVSTAVDEGAVPDRIVLNPTPTPATSQEATWRTDSAVDDGWVEFQPSAGAEDRWTPLEVSKPVLDPISKVPVEIVTLDGARHLPLEEPGLTQMADAIVASVEKVTAPHPA